MRANDDWSKLREATAALERYGDTEFEDVWVYVPKLLDAYAELWELSQALLVAVEDLHDKGQGGLVVATMDDVPPF